MKSPYKRLIGWGPIILALLVLIVPVFAQQNNINLVAICSPAPESYRVWRVSNPTDSNISFIWETTDRQQHGSGTVATMSEITFQSQTQSDEGANTVKLFVGDVQVASANSISEPCETPGEPGNVTPTDVAENRTPPNPVIPGNQRPINNLPGVTGGDDASCGREDCSSVSVSAVCSAGLAVFTITNTGEPGNGDMIEARQWRLYVNDSLVDTGSFILEGGQSGQVRYQGNGQAIRLEADQQAWHPGNSHPRETIRCVSESEALTAPASCEIIHFELWNADTDSFILSPLNNQDVIDVADFDNARISIVAVTEPSNVGSVSFSLTGAEIHNSVENFSPYSLFGDNVAGDIYGEHLSPGAYSLTAIAYLDGEVCSDMSIDFTVIDTSLACEIVHFELWNADTDSLILSPLNNQDVIDVATFDNAGITIVAVTEPSSVGSVAFSLTGAETHESIENFSPYSLFGDNVAGDFSGEHLSSGVYLLIARAYTESHLDGELCSAGSLNFSIVDTSVSPPPGETPEVTPPTSEPPPTEPSPTEPPPTEPSPTEPPPTEPPTTEPPPTEPPTPTEPPVACNDYDVPASDATAFAEAVVLANTDGRPSVICLGGGVYAMTASQVLSTDISIIGNGSSVVPAGNFGASLFEITGTVSIENLNINNGSATFGAGILVNGGTATLTDILFSLNIAGQDGGALYNFNGNVTITNGNFAANQANIGAAIFNTGVNATLSINDTELSRNEAIVGGAIRTDSGTLTIDGSEFIANMATSESSAISLGTSGSVNIQNTVITENLAASGAALTASNTNFVIKQQLYL